MYERCVACQNRGDCSTRSANTSISLNCTTNRSPRASTPSSQRQNPLTGTVSAAGVPQMLRLRPKSGQRRAMWSLPHWSGLLWASIRYFLITYMHHQSLSSRASRPRSSLRSASRAPRRPRAGLPRFGDTSDVLSQQPLRDGRVDRCWCQ